MAGDPSRFRPPGSHFGYGSPSDVSGFLPPPLIPFTETPAQLAVSRETLWKCHAALERLVRAAAGRRGIERFELAVENGGAVLALVGSK